MENKINKKFIFVISLFIFFLIGGCAQENKVSEDINSDENNQNQVLEDDYLTYSDSSNGVKLKYPENWNKKKQGMGSVISFIAPIESSNDEFGENVNLVIQDLSSRQMTLEEYTNLSINQLNQYVTNLNIMKSSSTTLDENPAHKMVYTGKQGVVEIKWMQVWTIKDDKAYILTYTSEISSYDKYVGKFQKMINSFEMI